MRETLEVRWFYEGPLPPRVMAWFGALPGTMEEEGLLPDRYLLPTDPGLGVKVREGDLEVKRQAGAGEVVVFGRQARGTLEHWCKWSFPLTAAAKAPTGAWVEVRKQRFKRYYSADAAAGVVPCGGGPGLCCQVELARLEADARLWWSICFEATGEVALLRDFVVHVGTRLFATGNPPLLAPEHAASYPAWLLRSVRRGA